MIQTVRIPADRVGALIGRSGEIKEKIEHLTGVKLSIDSEEGDVEIDMTHATDPGTGLAVPSVVMAIGRGFSPGKALFLLEDQYILVILDIRDYVGKKQEHVRRMRSRVIGTRGKTRELFEELTGAHISIYGNTVAIIGTTVQAEIARRGMDMLLLGSEHATVYHFLEHCREGLKIDGMGF
ncbi:MAG TPA: KH domain-containing protein [Thermoplasmata archaeon]|nr:KH domain-containing protein [Thermoplasmata archaeon]